MVSGDVLEVKINDPDLGAFLFLPKAGEAFTLDPGGFVVTDDANMVDGGGRHIQQMTRKLWSLEGSATWAMAEENELARLQALANNPKAKTITMTHVSGAVFSGSGTIVGDIQGDTYAGTFPLKLAGGGQLTRQ